jgi:nitroimidazol reductase NimA-like FMN-containing flavoprotein (pyridoxamine 5'-phosphate oxidase superfamily)
MSTEISKQAVISFLKHVPVMSIAVNLDEKPVSSVVAFAVDNDLSFYFVTKRNTYKSQALKQNNNISLSVWELNNMLVQAAGQVREIADQEELENTKKRVIESLAEYKNFWWPINAIQGGEFVAYKVQTDWLRVLDLDNTVPNGQKRYFEIGLQSSHPRSNAIDANLMFV